jgi:hypothetical protein
MNLIRDVLPPPHKYYLFYRFLPIRSPRVIEGFTQKKHANRSPRASNKGYILYCTLLGNRPKPYRAQTQIEAL